jgi:selenocysteine-specific elongation factor
MDELRAALAGLAAALPGADPAAPVRLWIDRSFTIRGSGTVVTGTLPAGTVRNGQELLLTPSSQPVRVRGLQALGEPAERVTGVARVALNLRGVAAGVPERGMALIEPGRWTLTAELDVRITPPAAGLPAKFPPELLLHIGSARTAARLRILGAGDPAAVYVRLRLRDRLPLHAGDRVLLRDPGAAALAIYGATVLDPAPPPLGRRGAGTAAVRDLDTWPDVPTAADLLRRHRLLRSATLTAMGVTELPPPVAGDWLADPAHWARLRADLPKAVATFLSKDELAIGMPLDAARAALNLPSRDLVVALAAAPSGSAEPTPAGSARPAAHPDHVVIDGGYLRIAVGQPSAPPRVPATPGAPAAPGTAQAPDTSGTPATTAAPGVQLPPRVASAVQVVLDDLAKDPFAAPDTERLRELGLDARALAAAARGGLLLRLAELVVLAPGADKEAARLLGQLQQPFTTSQARQALGTSRRVAIPLLEYLDRAGVTERMPGDLRRLRPR